MKKIPDSVLIKIKATHFEPFINKNSLKYTKNAVVTGIDSWTKPYNKPQLVMHDKRSDPIGRIVDSKIIENKGSLEEPANYIQLTAKITNKDAVEKIIDGRYFTVSVGSSSSRVICSECNQVITEDGLCEHKKGSYNEDGKLIYWIIDQITYTEDSFVNEPADEFACIEEIKIKDKWIPYKEFIDNYNDYLILEDSMNVKDAKLSTEARNKLSESSFCGPGRSFPAHDKAHVTVGLRLLNKSNFSEATKAKIKACLYRKGKRYGIAPSEDELKENPNILTSNMEDNWTPEQLTEIETYFKANPDADLPESNDESTENKDTNIIDYTKMGNEDLVKVINKLEKELEDSKKIVDEKIKEIEDLTLVSNSKEDEINKLLDEVAVSNKKYKDSLISNILDLQMTDNKEERDSQIEKYQKRTVESLTDTLEDLKSQKTKVNSSEKVPNTTLQTDKNSDINQNIENKDSDRFGIFYRDRSSMEV